MRWPWRRRRDARTSWVWHPKCRRDLNGDNESFVSDDEVVTQEAFEAAFNQLLQELASVIGSEGVDQVVFAYQTAGQVADATIDDLPVVYPEDEL